MILVDVHAHMDFEAFDNDREELLADCEVKGVKAIIANGLEPKTNRKVSVLAQKFPLIKPAYGYYPSHIIEDGVKAVDEEIAWIKQQRPIAIGEIGLDYKEFAADGQLHKEEQQAGFRKLVKLGIALDIPLIIHSRKAESDVLTILEEEQAKKVVLHCFMGKKKLMQKAIDQGYSFSIPVIVTKLEQTQWLAANTPLAQLFTETDAPYLGPIPGERNDPRNVLLAVKKIAEIKGLTLQDTANQIFMNYQKMFW